MVKRTELEELHEALRKKRREVFERRKNIDSSWKELHEPEVEREEMAQKEKMAQGLDQLDAQEKEQIEAIDMALHRIAAGNYGICLECGKDIELKRLQALPWARRCIQCATGRENVQTPGEAEVPGHDEEFSPLAGLSDTELEETIWDELRTDDRLDTQELEITCEEGMVTLSGAIPSHQEHARLIDILESVLGVEDIVDNLRIEHVSWQRRDRAQGTDDEEENEGIMLSEDEDVDSWDPPEELVPEKKE